MSHRTPLLNVKDLSISFDTDAGSLQALFDVSFSLQQGETLCLVGESGCGKSMTALAVMGLLPENGYYSGGSLYFEGNDIRKLTPSELRALQGKHMSMVFQDPMTSLNPVMRVGAQVAESIRLHLGLSAREAQARVIELFRLVGIPSPELRFHDYPHQMSGGMRQRVMIAMALCCSPQLLLADEPTTALDVTIQSQIIALLRNLTNKQNTAVLLITHDLGVVAQAADTVAVMYAGRIVEKAPVRTLFRTPRHPYTIGLMNSAPSLDTEQNAFTVCNTLLAIPGSVPPLGALPAGCPFQDRCSFVLEQCRHECPPLEPVDAEQSTQHLVRCWLTIPTAYHSVL